METTGYPMAEAVRAAYRAGQEDEALEPLVRVDRAGQPVGSIQDGDYVIFYDIRGEREIELTSAFVDPDFAHFARPPMTVALCHHDRVPSRPGRAGGLSAPGPRVQDTLCEMVSRAGWRQVKVVESEKAIHVSFFLNGKRPGSLSGRGARGRPLAAAGHPRRDAARDERRGPWPTRPSRPCAIPATRLVTVNLCNVDVIGHIENPDAIRVAVRDGGCPGRAHRRGRPRGRA